MPFETVVLRMREVNREDASQFSQRLLGLAATQMLLDSFGHRLNRILQIAERQAWFSEWPADEDVSNLISQFQRPRKSIVTSVAEYTARGSAAFAPAYEKATTYGGEAEFGRYWLGPNLTDLVFRGTLKHLEDGHGFDAGNERLTRILDATRRNMVGRLLNSRLGMRGLPPTDLPAFVDIDSRANRRIQAADIAAGLARYVLSREGPEGLVKRWAKVYYNGSRLTENNLEPVLRFWSTVRN